MKNSVKITLISALIGNFLFLNIALAADFDGGNIIADRDLIDYKSMSLGEINDFLSKKDGRLDKYTTIGANGTVQSAGQIIYDASQNYQINPKFLLVLLQREQSLVEDGSPLQKQYDWAMGYGVCDSCSFSDPAVQIFKGFYSQVDHAAGSQRWFLENANNGWVKVVGRTYMIDGQRVTFDNQATANLFNYTPHILGNYNFWKIWNRWFTQVYPDGVLLKADGDKSVWLIQNGQRRLFKSMAVLMTRSDPKQIITVGKNELNKYEIGRPIQFANYSLLTTPLGNSYLLVDDTLRPFDSKETIRQLGFNPMEFQDISFDEFSQFSIGDPITVVSAYPSGTLLQDKTTGGVFFVRDGNKAPVISREILKMNFPNQKITRVDSSELDKYALVDSVKLKDGSIVRSASSPSVYVISNGLKRPIASGEVFEHLGYKWNNVKVVEDVSLSNMSQGSYVDLNFKQ
ncbi:MAG: hypothetical protein V1763_01850 [Parcubacteria group bacterium]